MLNYRAGLPASATYNVHRDPKKQKALDPLDFFGARQASDPEASKASAMSAFAANIRSFEKARAKWQASAT